MTLQYLRRVSLVFSNEAGDTADLSDLHFKFRVARGDIQSPNTADIRVYNVSDETLNALQKEFSAVTLQAGYEGSFGVIFNGTVMQIRRGRENPTDTYLDITAADGDAAYNFGIVNVSLAAGSTPKQQVDAITKALKSYGIAPGGIEGLPEKKLPRGKVMFGLARDSMRTIAEDAQVSWSFQNGKIQTVPLNGYMQGSVVEINSTTGMIGLPEQTLDGIKVRTLLNPNIKIGSAIRINNASILQFRYGTDINSFTSNALAAQSIHTNADGLYKVLYVNYDGDTRGQSFYSDITCVSIDANITPAMLAKTTVTAPGVSAVKPYAPGDKPKGQ